MTRCAKCGLSLVGEVRSRRLGADEPGVLVVCRCAELGDTHGYVVRLIEEVASLAFLVGGDEDGTDVKTSSEASCFSVLPEAGCSEVEYEVSLDGELSRRCWDMPGFGEGRMLGEEGCAASLREGEVRVSCRARMRTDASGAVEESLLKVVDFAALVAPGMTFRRSRELGVDVDAVQLATCGSLQRYRLCFEERRMKLGKWICKARRYKPGNRYAVEFEYASTSPIADSDKMEILVAIHARFCHVEKYAKALGRQTLARLRAVALPVKDVRMVPQHDVSYRVKVDGEHAWLFEAGSMWYICRSDPHLTVVGFRVKSVLDLLSPLSMVLRVEQLPDGSLVLIDMLAVGGVVEQTSRPYDAYRKLLLHRYVPDDLVIREEFDSLEQAQESRRTVSYGSDGVIVIDKTCSLTYRLKRPTLDMLSERGSLYVSVRGKPSRRVGVASSRMQSGVVYECTIEPPSNGVAAISSYASRTDKLSPNPSRVFDNVMSILQSTDDSDLSLIDRVSAYSFAVRGAMYEWTSNRGYLRGLVVDVGTGRLQAQDVIFSCSQCSYLLCDPRLDLTHIRTQVTVLDVTHFDAAAMVELIQGLSRSRRSYAGYRGRVERLIAMPGVMQALKRNHVSMVYSFSLSYVARTFNQLARYGVKQIGCCYVYDAVDDEGVLVNVGGIHLRVHDKEGKRASATFGGKASFTEPAVTRESFCDGTVTSALSLAGLQGDADPRMASVVQHIVVATSF